MNINFDVYALCIKKTDYGTICHVLISAFNKFVDMWSAHITLKILQSKIDFWALKKK